MTGHGLVLDIKQTPDATGTIRMGVAAPHNVDFNRGDDRVRGDDYVAHRSRETYVYSR